MNPDLFENVKINISKYDSASLVNEQNINANICNEPNLNLDIMFESMQSNFNSQLQGLCELNNNMGLNINSLNSASQRFEKTEKTDKTIDKDINGVSYKLDINELSGTTNLNASNLIDNLINTDNNLKFD